MPFLKPEAYRNTTDDELAFQLLMYKESMNAALELLHVDRESRREFIEDVMKIDRDVAKTILVSKNICYVCCRYNKTSKFKYKAFCLKPLYI